FECLTSFPIDLSRQTQAGSGFDYQRTGHVAPADLREAPPPASQDQELLSLELREFPINLSTLTHGIYQRTNSPLRPLDASAIEFSYAYLMAPDDSAKNLHGFGGFLFCPIGRDFGDFFTEPTPTKAVPQDVTTLPGQTYDP